MRSGEELGARPGLSLPLSFFLLCRIMGPWSLKQVKVGDRFGGVFSHFSLTQLISALGSLRGSQ